MKSRLLAVSIHLAVSTVIAIATLILIFQFWYPLPFASAMDVKRVAIILLLVDLSIGPLLTFVVYKKEKKSLKFDLSVIFLLQMIGLFIGMNSLYQGRPAWIVFVEDRFEVVRPADVDDSQKKGVSSSFFGPVWAAIPPMSDAEKAKIFAEVLKGEPDLSMRPVLYENLGKHLDVILKRSADFSVLRSFNKKDDFEKYNSIFEKSKWVPVQLMNMSLVAVLNDEGVVEVVDLRAWESF